MAAVETRHAAIVLPPAGAPAGWAMACAGGTPSSDATALALAPDACPGADCALPQHGLDAA
jgi:hypothetical protein